MKILRRIIRRKLCHPVVIGAAAVVLLFTTSEKWTPYIKDRLYQEAATANDVGAKTENIKKKDKTVQQSEVRESNKQESRKPRIEKGANQEKTTAASDVSDKTKASKGKKKKSVKKSVTESKAYQDTAEDVKKTVNDTKAAADRVKKYLDEAKKRGEPIMEENMPGVSDEKPQIIQDGVDTVKGIRKRIVDLIKGAAETANE